MAYRDSFSFGYSLTPWVRRLIVANIAVFLLTWAVPSLELYLAFAPSATLSQPWTILTYMFVHAGFWHIFFNMLALFFFGPAVEERFGSGEFIRYYLVCGLGGAALSFLFAWNTSVVGASAAVYGVMLAYAIYWPDNPIYIWGILPVKAKWLVLAFVVFTLVSAFDGRMDGTAHFAHLGGFAAGFLYLKAAGLGTAVSTRARKLFRPKLTVIPGSGTAAPPKPARPRRSAEEERMLDDLDRVLEKISQSGIASLTPDERKLLDEASRRYRQN